MSNFAERLDIIDERIAREVGYEPDDIYSASPNSKPAEPVPTPSTDSPVLVNKVGLERHLILRGFRIRTEMHAFKDLLENPDHAGRGVRDPHWHLARSASFYLLLVLGLPGAGRKLVPEDSHRLHDFRSLLANRKDLAGVRELAAGSIEYGGYARRTDVLNDRAIQTLLEDVVRVADIILTTPALSCDGQIFQTRKEEARWISIDEAGNMSRPDEVSVRGNTCLPCVLAGDHLQLPPMVIAAKDVDAAGNARNRHGADAGMSSLVRAMTAGAPTYRLRTQLRMARGMFDLAGRLIYSDLDWEYGPGTDISLPQHEPGRLLEAYVLQQFPDVKPSPNGTLSPVFLHAQSFVIVNEVTGSKCNPVQVTVALNFLTGFVQATGVDPASIVIITPYAWNADLINRKLRKPAYTALNGMRPAQTVDSYQGREGDIAVNILVATKKTGPGFTGDKYRLNVSITRQRCGLILIGDINVTGEMMANKGGKNRGAAQKAKDAARAAVIAVESPTGEIVYVNPGVLKKALQSMVAAGRVARVETPRKGDEREDDMGEKVAAEEAKQNQRKRKSYI